LAFDQPSLFLAGEYDTVVQDMHRDAFNTLEQTMPGLPKKVLLRTPVIGSSRSGRPRLPP